MGGLQNLAHVRCSNLIARLKAFSGESSHSKQSRCRIRLPALRTTTLQVTNNIQTGFDKAFRAR